MECVQSVNIVFGTSREFFNGTGFDVNMDEILINLGLHRHVAVFQREKITPDIICDLSMYEFNCLGITNRHDVMNLRTACVHFGNCKPPKSSSTAGCPSFRIPKTILESMLDIGFTVKEISDFFAVSERTIYRRMMCYGLRKNNFTDISDELLTEIVLKLVKQFPRCGEKMLRELLRQKNIHIPRSRLRDVLQAHDKNGIRYRTRRRLHRRVYQVKGPNYVWHLDTNHKLIRWNVVIAAGIDGFSRMIMYIKALTNNKSDTLLQIFREAVQKFGTPLRIRTDKGMENVKIADFILRQRGIGSVLAGKSVYNQRIERLWRDVYDGVLGFYSELFSFMEDEGILDIMDPIHIFALHFVYLQRINECLATWCEAWSTHRLRTARSSPLRLWTAGIANNPIPVPESADVTFNEDEDENNVSVGDSRPVFTSPEVHISDYCKQQLDLHCPHNWTGNNYGIDIYKNAVSILHLSDN